METITNILNGVLGWFEIIPVHIWSVFLGLMLSLLLTQFIKRALPIAEICNAARGERLYRTVIQLVAFGIAAVATFATWPEDVFRIYVAIGVGAATPVFYFVATRLAYRFWDNLEAKLSGHLSE